MDIRKIKKLMELLENSSVDELEVKEGEETVRLSRHLDRGAGAPPVQAPVPVPVAPPVVKETPEVTSEKGADPDEQDYVRSPIVGTFYRSPAPGAPPFVEVGQQVAKGDVVGIVEAMKMMNQIEAPKAGTIKSVLAEDGQPLEFDQPLMIIA